jgi:alkyldihydroxyacetonephosphate synthase
MLFDTFERGVEAVRAVSQAALFPSNCRLLDAREALFHGAGDGQSAVLLLGFESADHALEEKLARAIAIAEAHGGRLARPPVHRTSGARGSDATSESWRASFFAAPYRQSALLTLGVMADTFETACTWDRFAACHRAITTALEDALLAHAGGGVWSCRFTHVYPDGPAPYYTFVAQLPARPLESWRAIKGAVSDAILESGATITHHHAVGRTHHPWYARERPALFGDAVAAVKRTLDPPGILNPGVLVGGGNDE